MANEKVKLEYLVTPVLDQRATTNVVREIEKIAKRGTQLNFTKVVKEANNNVKAINEISKAAEAFSKKLSAATQNSVRRLKELGQELAEAQQEAKALSEAYAAESDDSKKAEIQKKIQDLATHIGDLNKEITGQKSALKTYRAEIQRASAAQKKSIEKLNQFATFSPKDALKGVLSGLGKALTGDAKQAVAGIGEALGSAAQGVRGGVARRAQTRGLATGGPEGNAAMAEMGKAMGALSGAVGALVMLMKFINKATGAMAELNKNLLKGSGFARDMGVSGQEYAQTLKNMRDAAMDAHGALLKFGGSSETAMAAAGAFAKEASGSIVQTEAMLKEMGGGDLKVGMFELAKNAQVYGKALGMEATDVASFMGQMVNEVGVSHENINKVMGDVVKQAAQAGIPVNKFMAIFKDAIPELDLFTNRIEEVTGVVKLMSKTMDPRQLKQFMQAFGKGFDQQDFKQRLKMALVVGPGKMSKIMEKDFARSTENMAAQLKDVGLDKEFREALKAKDVKKAVNEVAAKAMAAGVDPTKISAMHGIARGEALRKSGDVTKMATGMREMGILGRMEALEDYAGKFTGGDLTGIGEHVAKQLGVSEQEYKALIALKDNMADNTASVRKTGRTSSKSINDNLKKMLKLDKKQGESDEDFEKRFEGTMKGLSDTDLQEKLKIAATMQLAEDQKNAKSAEEIAQEQVIATTSLGDKMENVLGFLLEKLYYVIDTVVAPVLNGMFSWMTGGEGQREMLRSIDQMREDAKKSFGSNQAAYSKFSEDMNSVQRAVAAGKGSKELVQQFGDKLMGLAYGGVKDAEGRQKTMEMLNKYMGREDSTKFIAAYEKGDIATTSKMLEGMDTDKMVKLLAELSKQQAMTAEGVGRGKKPEEAALLKAKLRTGGSDLDPRTAQLQGKAIGDAAAKKIAQEEGIAPPGAPPAPDAKAAADAAKKAAEAVKPAAAVGTPGAPGAPAPAAGPKPAEVKAATTAAKDTAKTQEDQAKAQETQISQGEDIYKGVNDQLQLLKKGIKYEQSWLTGKYQNVLKEATLDSFRTALFEFAMLTQWDKVKDWAKDFKDKGVKPGSLSDFMKETGKWAQERAPEMYGFAEGGPVNFDQMAKVHSGEYVVPKGGVLVKEGGNTSNTRNVTVNATINVHTDADPKQIAAEVHNLYRAH